MKQDWLFSHTSQKQRIEKRERERERREKVKKTNTDRMSAVYPALWISAPVCLHLRVSLRVCVVCGPVSVCVCACKTWTTCYWQRWNPSSCWEKFKNKNKSIMWELSKMKWDVYTYRHRILQNHRYHRATTLMTSGEDSDSPRRIVYTPTTLTTWYKPSDVIANAPTT